MAGEFRHFYTRVVHPNVTWPAGEEVMVLINLIRITRSRCRRSNGIYESTSCEEDMGSRLIYLNLSRAKLLSHRPEYTQIISEPLSSMGVPRDEHLAIIEEIFLMVDCSVSPKRPIFVIVRDTIDRNLEFQTPSCAICLEDFAEEEEEESGVDLLMITRMPCAHRYHQHCIVPWLAIKRLCPLCRTPMPTLESNPNPN